MDASDEVVIDVASAEVGASCSCCDSKAVKECEFCGEMYCYPCYLVAKELYDNLTKQKRQDRILDKMIKIVNKEMK